jgi:hypothetical protein
VARSPNGERAHRRGARAAPRARSLRRRSVAQSSSESPLRRARGSGGKENEARVCARPASAVLFGREPRAAVGFRWTAHIHRTEFQPKRDETFPAQAQVAAWSMGSVERERAGVPFFVSGRSGGLAREPRLRKSGSRAIFGFGPFRGQARGEFSARTGCGPISFWAEFLQ